MVPNSIYQSYNRVNLMLLGRMGLFRGSDPETLAQGLYPDLQPRLLTPFTGQLFKDLYGVADPVGADPDPDQTIEEKGEKNGSRSDCHENRIQPSMSYLDPDPTLRTFLFFFLLLQNELFILSFTFGQNILNAFRWMLKLDPNCFDIRILIGAQHSDQQPWLSCHVEHIPTCFVRFFFVARSMAGRNEAEPGTRISIIP